MKRSIHMNITSLVEYTICMSNVYLESLLRNVGLFVYVICITHFIHLNYLYMVATNIWCELLKYTTHKCIPIFDKIWRNIYTKPKMPTMIKTNDITFKVVKWCLLHKCQHIYNTQNGKDYKRSICMKKFHFL